MHIRSLFLGLSDQVYAIRPASLEDLIEDKAKERELQELVNGDEVPYEPGVTYVYQLLK